MCNINKIIKEKENLMAEVEQVMQISGANIISIRKDMEKLTAQSENNIKKLSLLL